jgi:hypothetical protein
MNESATVRRNDLTFPAIGDRVTLTHYYIGDTFKGTHSSPDFTVTGTVYDTPAAGAAYVSLDADDISELPDGISSKDAWIDGETVYVAIGAFQEWSVAPAPAIIILAEEATAIEWGPAEVRPSAYYAKVR